jgi:hypothetical protein
LILIKLWEENGIWHFEIHEGDKFLVKNLRVTGAGMWPRLARELVAQVATVAGSIGCFKRGGRLHVPKSKKGDKT